MRRVPANVAEGTLLGGLDLPATLSAGLTALSPVSRTTPVTVVEPPLWLNWAWITDDPSRPISRLPLTVRVALSLTVRLARFTLSGTALKAPSQISPVVTDALSSMVKVVRLCHAYPMFTRPLPL